MARRGFAECKEDHENKQSITPAAIHCRVPRRTHTAYLAENKHSRSKLWKKAILSPQKEHAWSKRIIGLTQTGYP